MAFRDGDGWVMCSCGHKHWGLHGAAGLLLIRLDMPEPHVLLQLRAEWSHSGGTWGIPGGALKMGEDAVGAALRESHEEAGVPADYVRVLETSVLDLGFWSYTTVLAIADDYFEPVAMDLESAALEWVPMSAVQDRDLHPGFGRAWADLRALLENQLRD